MKNYIFNLVLVIAVCSSFMSCEKDEIDPFKGSSAINFIGKTASYSFVQDTNDEEVIEIPVRIMGDSTSYDRNFAAMVVDDSLTTAKAELYEIQEGVVKAGEFKGLLYLKVKNAAALDTTKVSLHLKITESEDFKIGNVESIDFTFTWSNTVIVPAWTYFRYFFTRYPSTAAYRAFIAATGLTDFTRNDYIYVYGATGAQVLGKQYGDYIRQYEIDNGTPLLHDDGAHAGEPIVPIY